MSSGEIKNGSIKSQPTGWTASFKIQMQGMEGVGDFVADVTGSAIESFSGSDVTATYKDVSKLTGVPTSKYTGTIGGGSVDITLDSDVTFKGSIEGGPVTAQKVSGSGEWKFVV